MKLTNLLLRLWLGRTCNGRRRKDVQVLVLGTIVYNASYGTNSLMRMWSGWIWLRIASLVSTEHHSLSTTEVTRQLVIHNNQHEADTYFGLTHFFAQLNIHAIARIEATPVLDTPNLYGIISTSRILFEEFLYIKKSIFVVALSYKSFSLSVHILKYLQCQHLFLYKEIHQYRFIRADKQA